MRAVGVGHDVQIESGFILLIATISCRQRNGDLTGLAGRDRVVVARVRGLDVGTLDSPLVLHAAGAAVKALSEAGRKGVGRADIDGATGQAGRLIDGNGGGNLLAGKLELGGNINITLGLRARHSQRCSLRLRVYHALGFNAGETIRGNSRHLVQLVGLTLKIINRAGDAIGSAVERYLLDGSLEFSICIDLIVGHGDSFAGLGKRLREIRALYGNGHSAADSFLLGRNIRVIGLRERLLRRTIVPLVGILYACLDLFGLSAFGAGSLIDLDSTRFSGKGDRSAGRNGILARHSGVAVYRVGVGDLGLYRLGGIRRSFVHLDGGLHHLRCSGTGIIAGFLIVALIGVRDGGSALCFGRGRDSAAISIDSHNFLITGLNGDFGR